MRARELGTVAWSSLAAAALGSVVAGLYDCARDPGSLLVMAGTIGFGAIVTWPVLTVLAWLGLLLARAWRLEDVVDAWRDPAGGVPRLAAAVVYLAVAAVALGAATYLALDAQAAMTAFVPNVVALVTPAIVVVSALVLVALAPTLSAPITRGFRALDARAQARRGHPAVTATRVAAVSAIVVVLIAWIAWRFVVRPQLALYDLRFLDFPIVATLVAALAHPLIPRVPARARAAITVGGVGVVAVTVALAGWIRARAPLELLEVWSKEDFASMVIAEVVDLQDLRSDLALQVARPVALPDAPHPSVILITIDTVRADRTPLSPRGGAASMPALAALGARGAVFTRAYAPGNVTRRSIPSLAMGVSPTRVRGKVAGWALRLDPRHVLLAERFRAADYDTAGYLCCNAFWAPQHQLGLNRGLTELVLERDGAALAAAAAEWLRQRASDPRPFFLWMHFIEPHGWKNVPITGASGGDLRRARYDSALSRVDQFLATVLGAVAALPTPAQPIVAMTSDHGEGLGDHGQTYHSTDLYESQIHVPFVVAGPSVGAGVRIDEPVGLVDLAPTLLELAGFAAPGMPEMDGRSLVALVRRQRPPDPDGGYAFSTMIADRSVKRGARAVVRGRWKLIDGVRGQELYDVVADPEEKTNLAAREPERLRELEALLAARATIDRVSPFVGFK